MMPLEPIYAYDEQDAFIFGSRKKRKARREKRRQRKAARASDPKIIARRERSKAFGRKLGAAYQDIGGASAIGRAIDSLTTSRTSVTPDTNISLGLATDTLTNIPEQTPQNRGIPTLVYILGGIVIIGGVTLFIIKRNKP